MKTSRIGGLLVGLALAAASGRSQTKDPLEGRWQGMVKSPLGERQATVTIKNEGGTYIGGLSGFTGTTELPFKEVKLDGNKVTARMQIEAPQGLVTVDFDFTLAGDALSGKGEAGLGGPQPIVFNF